MRSRNRFPWVARPSGRQHQDSVEELVDEVFEEATSRAFVLVLIEHPVLRVAVTSLLREREYRVRESHSLAAALEHAEIEPPDLVVADITGDRARARHLASSFRSLRRVTPLVGIAADSQTANSGFDALLLIPFSGRQLLEVVDLLLGRDQDGQRQLGGAA